MKNNKDQRKEVVFFSLGGGWSTILKNGKLIGNDFLGEEEFYNLEKKFGYFDKNADYKKIEWEFAQHLNKIFTKQPSIQKDLDSQLKFSPKMHNLVKGKFIMLYSIQSDFMRASIVAPTVSTLLQWANEHSTTPILIGFGTDTADISVPQLLDVYSFDSNLPPFIFTGANRSAFQKNSDAPENFYDLARAATINLSPGSYWVFAGQLFKTSDLVKISPYESREIDNLSTFYSPHSTAEKIEDLLKDKARYKEKPMVKINHISRTTTMERIFHAIEEVQVVDIGQEYELDCDMKKILDLNYKAVIIVGHSSGTASNPIFHACVQAALHNKLVIIVTRCLASDIFAHYNFSLINANNTALRGKGKKIISGHKLNKYVARSLAIRAVDENLNQNQTDELFQKYALSRKLSEHDVFVL